MAEKNVNINKNVDEETIAWHPGFVNAMKLELIENEKDLDYETEHLLNQQPIKIDFLVIKKSQGKVIKNEIGKYFRGHNLMEYKSEEDALNIDTVYKSLAYAGLYKAYAANENGINADDITITIVRYRKPDKLFRYLNNHNYKLSENSEGIYYVEGFDFPIQIVVLRKLSEEHLWLTSLTTKLDDDKLIAIFSKANKLKEKNEKMYVDSVLSVVTRANSESIERLKGEDSMCKELFEIMKPEIDEVVNKAVAEAVAEAVDIAVTDALSRNKRDQAIKMLRMDMPYDFITNLLDITVDEVKKIEEENSILV